MTRRRSLGLGRKGVAGPIAGDAYGNSRGGRLSASGYGPPPPYEAESDGDLWPRSEPNRPKLTEWTDLGLAEIDLRTTSWMNNGACVGHPEVDFFSRSSVVRRSAVDICANCAVVEECRLYALENHITDGVWGGLGREGLRSVERPAPLAAVVYFAADADLTFIKIGTSIEVAKRVRTQDLDLLATEPGSFQREADLHRQFAHLRIAGERFEPGDDLLAYIDGLLGRVGRVAA